MKITLDTEQFYIVGNNLALDFINSVNVELTLESLLGWAVAADLVKTSEAEGLSRKWDKRKPSEISRFRESLRQMVIDLVNRGDLTIEEVDWINRILRENGGYSELSATPDGFIKSVKIDLSKADKLRIPITESFVDMICYGQLDLIRKCERPDCVIYFYDTTKNHKRRWCSMSICGNRAKAAKFYKKKKSEI